VLRDLGHLSEAAQALEQGLALVQAQNNREQAAFFFSYLGTVSLQAGEWAKSIERASLALSLRRELGLRLRTPDDLATLATAHLALGQLAQALDCVDQALVILNECQGQGPEFPQRDYFACYQVLQAGGQAPAAREALQAAHWLVKARADKITALDLRQSFLEQVPINRRITQEWAQVSSVQVVSA
jgi:tetratricopeptide (TPR) repeat protein